MIMKLEGLYTVKIEKQQKNVAIFFHLKSFFLHSVCNETFGYIHVGVYEMFIFFQTEMFMR